MTSCPIDQKGGIEGLSLLCDELSVGPAIPAPHFSIPRWRQIAQEDIRAYCLAGVELNLLALLALYIIEGSWVDSDGLLIDSAYYSTHLVPIFIGSCLIPG